MLACRAMAHANNTFVADTRRAMEKLRKIAAGKGRVSVMARLA